MPIRVARTEIIKMILSVFVDVDIIPHDRLLSSLRLLDLNINEKNYLENIIENYQTFMGYLQIEKDDLNELNCILRKILKLEGSDFTNVANHIRKLTYINDEDAIKCIADLIFNGGLDNEF